MNKTISSYTIYPWMYDDYNLKGLDKELFAIICEHTKTFGCFSETLDYITEITGYSRQSIIPSLRKLIELGLITRDKFTYKSIYYV